ncbi:Jacalin-related lectin 39 [Arabidopsis thaliana]
MAFRMSRDHADFVAHGGTEWDDGAFVNVKKIKIFRDWAGITLVQFDYIDGTGAIVSGLDHGTEPFQFDREHGRVPVEGARAEFWLRDDEYITIVTAFGGYCVRKIEFITNKRTFDFGGFN